jgi:carbonic anhydrase
MSDLCSNGKSQSPINIIPNTAQSCNVICNLKFFYKHSNLNITNISNNIFFDYDSGSYVTYKDQVYQLDKISFSLPSSHTIDGFTNNGEIILHHINPITNQILQLSVFYQINNANSTSLAFFDIAKDHLPVREGSITQNTPQDWNIFNVIPSNKAFYSYEGSTLLPPCNENVTWIIMANPINVSVGFDSALKAILKTNNRAIQPLNDRPIYYNVNDNEANQINYGTGIECLTPEELSQRCGCLGSKPNEMDSYYKIMIILLSISCVVIAILLIAYFIQSGRFKGFYAWIGDTIRYMSNTLSSSGIGAR